MDAVLVLLVSNSIFEMIIHLWIEISYLEKQIKSGTISKG